MDIFCISGSASPQSSNYYLLKAIEREFSNQYAIEVFDDIRNFELFTPQRLEQGEPSDILEFKASLSRANALIIATPEYSHNIPAVLKNMLEWCTHSGEFAQKSVLPITFTPHEPRGKFAMRSLLMTLQTLQAKVVTQFPLYKTDVDVLNKKIDFSDDTKMMIEESLKLLI
ncbi:MAG: NAD(P)H-dependent oxidoreductase [Psychroflexus sp.]|nr:NAD(P)H-dependent oxidoreductase [Psychroflexus sp.]